MWAEKEASTLAASHLVAEAEAEAMVVAVVGGRLVEPGGRQQK